MQLVEVQVEREAQPPLLRHHVHEVGLGLVRDVQLEDLLADTGVERQNLLAERLEERPHGTVLGQVGVVGESVAGGALDLRTVALQNLVGQRGRCPDLRRLLGKPPRSRLDRSLVPGVESTQPLVHAERALPEPALHVALLGEGAVAVLRVVAGERQVAERVQPGLLYALPLRPQRLAPLRGEVLVLRQDVLDGVLVYRHALLAAVVLQPS